MKRKGIQHFSSEYLKNCKKMTTDEIVQFLEDFRQLHAMSSKQKKSKLISIKMPLDLLSAFRRRSQLEGVPYQTMIKNLMREWLNK
ncbi:MAG: hypothetical protein OXB88_02275 [Bacteriovoracales bacterium]|nr:hypothetical protein [Bacteriovoracales bacterium]